MVFCQFINLKIVFIQLTYGTHTQFIFFFYSLLQAESESKLVFDRPWKKLVNHSDKSNEEYLVKFRKTYSIKLSK